METTAKKFSFLNTCIAAALLILITLIGFRFLRNPESGWVRWELRDTTSGQLQAGGTLVLQPKDIEVEPLGPDNVLHTIHLNKDFNLDECTIPTSNKDGIVGIMVIVTRHNPDAMGVNGFKVIDGQNAKQARGQGRIKYQARKINGIWQLTRIEYASDIEYAVKILSRTGHSQKWTLTILKDSYINYGDANPD
jgi:hypothetical protein